MSVFSSCSVMGENSLIGVCESAFDMADTIETLEEGVFAYQPSMIPVLSKNTAEGTKYLVEMDMLAKLAAHKCVGIEEAFDMVCEENAISTYDTYVLASDPMLTIGEATDAIIGASDYEDQELYENKAMAIGNDLQALAEAGANVLYIPLCEESYGAVTPRIKVAFANAWRVFNTDKDVGDYKRTIDKAIAACRTFEDYVYTKRLLQLQKKRFENRFSDETTENTSYYDAIVKYLDSKINEVIKKMKSVEATSKKNIKAAKYAAKNDRKRDRLQKKLNQKLQNAKDRDFAD